MQYQVVARLCLPSVGNWEYYPYLAPGRDKAAAERLARYAAQSGYEAAILQSVTLEMLVCIGRGVVEQQDEQLVPMLRYMPGAVVERPGARREYDVETQLRAQAMANPYHEGPDKEILDERRTGIETGPGGDIAASDTWLLSFPLHMDIVRCWLRLRERVARGCLGGEADGADAAAM